MAFSLDFSVLLYWSIPVSSPAAGPRRCRGCSRSAVRCPSAGSSSPSDCWRDTGSYWEGTPGTPSYPPRSPSLWQRQRRWERISRLEFRHWDRRMHRGRGIYSWSCIIWVQTNKISHKTTGFAEKKMFPFLFRSRASAQDHRSWHVRSVVSSDWDKREFQSKTIYFSNGL